MVIRARPRTIARINLSGTIARDRQQTPPRLFLLPFKAAGVQSDLHEHGAAGVQVTALDGDPGSSGQRPGGGLDAGEIRRL